MIKIFRRFRQQLLTQNKFTKYLLYAIGEIILVVIGIVFALQLNSWNEQRLDNKKEMALLEGLKDEFGYNLNTLNHSIIVNGDVTNACFELTEIIRSNTILKNADLVDSLLVKMGGFSSFDARTGVTDEIINSGKLNLLKNVELRAQLTRWSGALIDAKEDILLRSDNYTFNLMPFLMKRIPLSNGELTKKLSFDHRDQVLIFPGKSPFEYNLSHKDLMEFENQIWHHKHNQDYIVINELNIRDFVNNTIGMIENELNIKH